MPKLDKDTHIKTISALFAMNDSERLELLVKLSIEASDKMQELVFGDLDNGLEKEIADLVRNGNKIAAIKKYREIHQTQNGEPGGLVEAKNAIEAWGYKAGIPGY